MVSCEEACRRADREAEPADMQATLGPLWGLSYILLDWVLEQAATQVCTSPSLACPLPFFPPCCSVAGVLWQ